MPDRILLVRPPPEIGQRLRLVLGGSCAVDAVDRADELLARIGADDEVAVVAGDLHGSTRTAELPARLAEEAPDVVIVRITDGAGSHSGTNGAGGSGGRILELPCSDATLRAAFEAALDEHRARIEQRELHARLDFTTQVLEEFNAELDARLTRQAASLEQLSAFVGNLGRSGSLQEIAKVALGTCAVICPNRGAMVELWTSSGEDERVLATSEAPVGDLRHVRPIETPKGQNGFLAVDELDGDGRRLTRAERSVLAAVASTCAVAVHNEVRRLERDSAQHATILALAKLAEQRDDETGKHLERVSLYCKLIAEGLRALPEFRDVIDDRFVRNLVRSAPLHDIGKVGIPDAILLKPGRLNGQEWEVMKTHTTIGAETLNSVMKGRGRKGFLEMSRDIAWCHHERWDGTGYPRGVAGDDIPLAARILTVADVYDALTSVRPYKGAWTHEQSLTAILAGSGTQFDPRLVEVFREFESEADEIRACLADSEQDLRTASQRAAHGAA